MYKVDIFLFKKINSKKLYMKIVDQILKLIKEGKLKPGEKLPPEQIMKKYFGVSRSSVREALCVLEILGAIESREGRGNIIKSNLPPFYEKKYMEIIKETSPFEILEARILFETEMTALATKRATKKDIIAIQEALEKMKQAIPNIYESIEANKNLHLSIAKAAHNNTLYLILEYLVKSLSGKLWINLIEKDWAITDHPKKYLEDHSEIVNSIMNKDSNSACKRMRAHLINGTKYLLNNI